MTLRNLRIFLTVAECGSMSEAAQRLNIAQPSVSGAIGEIEKRYNVRLFDRIGRGLSITPTGVQLRIQVRRILSLYDAMEQQLTDAPVAEELRIGATSNAGNGALGTILLKYLRKKGSVPPQVTIADSGAIEEKLLCGALDAALVEGRVSAPELMTRRVWDEPLVLICAKRGNPFGTAPSVSPDKLEEQPFLLREDGNRAREELLRLVPQADIQWVSTSDEVLIRAVAQGFGMAVVPQRLVEQSELCGRLAQLSIGGAEMTCPVFLAWNRSKVFTAALERFAAACGQYGQTVGKPAELVTAADGSI